MGERYDAPLAAQLQQIVNATPWLLDVLAAVRELDLPHAYVAAGCIRNTVWDSLHGRSCSAPSGDVDVVYFDPSDVPNAAQRLLSDSLPRFRWDVTNQATVHRWQSIDAGRSISAYGSLGAALASWPETATALAIRRTASDDLEFLAPFGLTDLFELRVRPNPTASNVAAYQRRRLEKKWQLRWPRLSVE